MLVDNEKLTEGEDELYGQIWSDMEHTIIDNLQNLFLESKML